MWEGHLRPVLDLVGPALSLSPASGSSLDGALRGGFGDGGMPHDVRGQTTPASVVPGEASGSSGFLVVWKCLGGTRS